MKKLCLPFLLAVTLLISSCATIFTGTKAKVKLTSNVSGLEVKVNGKPAKMDEKTGKISISKKLKDPVLEVARPGYETQKFTLARGKSGWGAANSWNVIGGSLIAPFGVLFQLGVLNGTEYDDKGNGTTIDNTGYAPPFYALGGLMLAAAIIDHATGANNIILYKELDFDMVPTPGRIKPESTEMIACNSVAIRIKTGSEVGSVYAKSKKGFKKVDTYKWDESSNIELDEMKAHVNSELSSIGYSVPGAKNAFKEDDRKPRFLINAEVIDLQYNVYNTVVVGFSTVNSVLDQNCTFKVRWTVFDTQKNTVVYEKETASKVWGNNQSIKLLALQSIAGNVKKLIFDEAWERLVRR